MDRSDLRGERRLAAAIVLQAIGDLHSSDPRMAQDALAFLRGPLEPWASLLGLPDDLPGEQMVSLVRQYVRKMVTETT